MKLSDRIIDEYFAKIYQDLLISLEDSRGGPFGAGIVLNGKLISTGTNEVMKTRDVSRHAEVVALSKATAKLGNYHVSEGILLTTHLPCLMCYHAAKWAKISHIYYIFDYDETESLFGFHGDERFLQDLNLTSFSMSDDPSVTLIRYSSSSVNEIYFNQLVEIWNNKYRDKLLGYDV